MLNTLIPSPQDLAGEINVRHSFFDPSFFSIQHRIRSLINNYLAADKLHERLQDLPRQFKNPQPRSWKIINWQEINREQIIGIDVEIFLSIIKGSLDTEAPIRGYTQTSRKYLEQLHPEMARFVGGTINQKEELIDIGLWEKEERQHTPALLKVYQQLTGEKINPTYRTVRGYLPTDNPSDDLYRHGLHRIATEYGATCLYIWLMAHTTGALQEVLEQLAIDEINHMTKFWGFGVWAYPDTSIIQVIQTFFKTRHQSYTRNNLIRTLQRMMGTLQWQNWSFSNKVSLVFTFALVLYRLWIWNKSQLLYLSNLFEPNLEIIND
jgi:hypothetical protein